MCELRTSLTLTYELTAGYNYELWQLADCHGLVWRTVTTNEFCLPLETGTNRLHSLDPYLYGSPGRMALPSFQTGQAGSIPVTRSTMAASADSKVRPVDRRYSSHADTAHAQSVA